MNLRKTFIISTVTIFIVYKFKKYLYIHLKKSNICNLTLILLGHC